MNINLNFDQLSEFAKWENARIAARENCSPRESVMLAMVKLSEEVGELSSEILRKFQLVRPEKIRENNDELEKEWADCFIVLLLLAERLGLDPQMVIRKKIEIIENRKY